MTKIGLEFCNLIIVICLEFVVCYLEFLFTPTLKLVPLFYPLSAVCSLLSTGLKTSPEPPQKECHQKHGQGPGRQFGPQRNHARENPPDRVYWNSETDSYTGAGWAEDCGINADYLAIRIYQGAPRISWVNRSVSLNDIFYYHILVYPNITPQRADSPGGQRLSQAEGVTKGQDLLPYPQTSRGAELQRLELFRRRLDFYHCQIVTR